MKIKQFLLIKSLVNRIWLNLEPLLAVFCPNESKIIPENSRLLGHTAVDCTAVSYQTGPRGGDV